MMDRPGPSDYFGTRSETRVCMGPAMDRSATVTVLIGRGSRSHGQAHLSVGRSPAVESEFRKRHLTAPHVDVTRHSPLRRCQPRPESKPSYDRGAIRSTPIYPLNSHFPLSKTPQHKPYATGKPNQRHYLQSATAKSANKTFAQPPQASR